MKRIILYVATDSLWVYVGLWMYVSRFKKNVYVYVYVWSLTDPQQEPRFCNVYFICLSYQYLIFIFCTPTYFLPHMSASTFQFHLIFQQLTKKIISFTESGIHNLQLTSPRRHLRNLSNHTERAVILCLLSQVQEPAATIKQWAGQRCTDCLPADNHGTEMTQFVFTKRHNTSESLHT